MQKHMNRTDVENLLTILQCRKNYLYACEKAIEYALAHPNTISAEVYNYTLDHANKGTASKLITALEAFMIDLSHYSEVTVIEESDFDMMRNVSEFITKTAEVCDFVREVS